MRRLLPLLGLLTWATTGCLESNSFIDPATLTDAVPDVPDSSAMTDADQVSDAQDAADAIADTAPDAAADSEPDSGPDTETDAEPDTGTDTAIDTADTPETPDTIDAEDQFDAALNDQLDAPDGSDAELADSATDAGPIVDDTFGVDAGPDALGDATDAADGMGDGDVGVAPELPDLDTAPDNIEPDAAPDAEPDTAGDPCLTLDCNDFNECTSDSCQAGQCVHANADVDCLDDGCFVRFCSGGQCKPTGGYLSQGSPCFDKVAGKGGYCSGETAVCGECATDDQCNSDNLCIVPKCLNSSCDYSTLATGKSCSDGNACTVGDACGTSLQDGQSGCKSGAQQPVGSSCTASGISSGLCDASATCVAPVAGQPFVVLGGSNGCSKPGWSLSPTQAGVWQTSPTTCAGDVALTAQSGGEASALSGPIALPQTSGRLQLEWLGACLTIESWDGGGWTTPVTNGACRVEVSTDNFATVAASQESPALLVGADPAGGATNLAIDLTAFAGKSVRLRVMADKASAIPAPGYGSGSLRLWLSDLAIRMYDSGLTTCVTGADCSDSDPCTLDVCVLGGCEYLPQVNYPCDTFQFMPNAICQVGGHCDAAGACLLDYATQGAECLTDPGDLGTCVTNLTKPGKLACKYISEPKNPQ